MNKQYGFSLMILLRKLAAAALLCGICINAAAKPVLKSSVSPEFTNGLHAKYLGYLAQKLDMELTLYPMPYARRIVSLQQGEIDIMVGLRGTYEEKGFEYLQPAYETLRTTYFVRADSANKLQGPQHFADMVLGSTIDQKQLQLDEHKLFAEVVTVSSLEQKIKLLHLGRIDAFVHFESSAQLRLNELGLENEIIRAPYQPGVFRTYHVAISKQSPLYKQKNRFEAVIKAGVASGDFAKIRLAQESN